MCVAVYAGCGLTTEGELAGQEPSSTMSPGTGGAGGGMPCTERGQCPSDTDCTTWACEAGNCEVTVAPNDTPLQAGTVGDCKKNVCQDGKPAVLNDDTDVAADNDPCTIEGCLGGVQQGMAAPDGTQCGATGTLGCVNGHCEGCVMNAANCDPSTDCKEATCPANTCVYTILEGKVTDDSSPTDCKMEVCDANGNKTVVGDTSETPPQVANNCKTEVCAMDGSVAEVNEADGTKCGDPMGVCYLDSVCENAACAQKAKPAGTKVMDNNKVGDCKALLCNGMGGTMEGPDDTDVPTDMSAGDCSVPGCMNGMVISTTKPKGDVCTTEVNGKCCGTNCCANALGGVPNYCDKNEMCCASNKACGGTCCMNTSASCVNNVCCETATVCNNVCCPTAHACDNLGACCPMNSRCPNGTCCPDGKNCNGNNMCAM
jgi:hypothetical protein